MSKKILLVDDDLDLQCLIKMALEIEDYEVLLANNGKEALEMIEAGEGQDIKCVILDLMMPIMGGEEMLSILRSKPQFEKLPVIISTAKGFLDEKKISNYQGLIKKPMKINNLYKTVKKYYE